jgi:biotin carboxyl carrier protein
MKNSILVTKFNAMYKAIANNQTTQIEFTKEGDIRVNEAEYTLDSVDVKKDYFHLIKDNVSYKAEIVRSIPEEKKYVVKINGKVTEIQLKDKTDILLEKMGIQVNSKSLLKELKAPMPGLIIEVSVQVGDEVKKGDTLLILEAMKMENVIKSPGEGIVKEVKAIKGQSVEKNAVLIQFS